jgi:hypothetical protein
MYRFLARLTPDDVEAIATQLYIEMLEAGYTSVAEFHYLHHDSAGKPYANPVEMAERICAAASAAGIGLTLLPVFYAHSNFGGLAPTPGQRRFITDTDRYSRMLDTRLTIRCTGIGCSASAWRRTRFERSRPKSCNACWNTASVWTMPCRSTSMPRNNRRKWTIASPGQARGPCNGCSTRLR